MKKTIFIIVFAFLGLAATPQEFEVFDKKPINNICKTKIQMSAERITRMQRNFAAQMKIEYIRRGTIELKGKIDTLFLDLWAAHYLFEDKLSEPDTITIIRYNGKFYENGDTTAVDLTTEKQSLKVSYDDYKLKYGMLSVYEPSYQVMLKRYLQLKDWEKQIGGN